MAAIVRVDEHDLPWAEYAAAGPGRVRVKAITPRGSGAPPVQYVEYAPGHQDGVHSHDEDEVFLITAGAVAGTFAAIYWANQYAVRTGLEPRRRELEVLLTTLNDETPDAG